MSGTGRCSGPTVLTPLFGARCRCRPHALADPEKGTGVAMICTFGDVTDVMWWRELALPIRAVLLPDGTLRPVAWGTRDGSRPRRRARRSAVTTELAGLAANKARATIVELLRRAGDLLGEPRPIAHPVKFYEKGDRPLEIITSRQWFVKTIEFREALIARGRELRGTRRSCGARYENWVEGPERRLVRQPAAILRRPVPGVVPGGRRRPRRYDRPIVAGRTELPIDPSTDVPGGLRGGAAR